MLVRGVDGGRVKLGPRSTDEGDAGGDGGRRVSGSAAAVSVVLVDLGVPVPGVPPVLAPLQSLGRRVWGPMESLAWSPSMSPSIPSMSEHQSWEVLVQLF